MNRIAIVGLGIISLIMCSCAEFWKDFFTDPSKYKDKGPNPWLADEYFNGTLDSRLHYESTGAYVSIENRVLRYFQLKKNGICIINSHYLDKWFIIDDTLFIEQQPRYSQKNELFLFKINSPNAISYIGRRGSCLTSPFDSTYTYLDFGMPLIFRPR